MSSWHTTGGEYPFNRIAVPIAATAVLAIGMISLDSCGPEEKAPNPAATAAAPDKLSSLAIKIVCHEEFLRVDTPKEVMSSYNSKTAQAHIDFACKSDGQLRTPVSVEVINRDQPQKFTPFAGNIKFMDIRTPYFEGQNPTFTQSTFVSPEGTGVAMERFSYKDVGGVPESQTFIPKQAA